MGHEVVNYGMYSTLLPAAVIPDQFMCSAAFWLPSC